MVWKLVVDVEAEAERSTLCVGLADAKERLYSVVDYLRIMGSEAVVDIERDGEVRMAATVSGGSVVLTWDGNGRDEDDERLARVYGLEECL